MPCLTCTIPSWRLGACRKRRLDRITSARRQRPPVPSPSASDLLAPAVLPTLIVSGHGAGGAAGLALRHSGPCTEMCRVAVLRPGSARPRRRSGPTCAVRQGGRPTRRAAWSACYDLHQLPTRPPGRRWASLRDPFCSASAKEHLPPPTPVERTTATGVGGTGRGSARGCEARPRGDLAAGEA